MVDTTLGGITLEGNGTTFVGDNSARKEAILTPMPLYQSDSDETEVFDYGGTIRTITIIGVFVGATKAACATFITDAEALITGAQEDTVEYTDEYRGTINIKVAETGTTKEAAEPLVVRWSFKLVEGKKGV